MSQRAKPDSVTVGLVAFAFFCGAGLLVAISLSQEKAPKDQSAGASFQIMDMEKNIAVHFEYPDLALAERAHATCVKVLARCVYFVSSQMDDAKVHDRMPVILAPDTWSKWLSKPEERAKLAKPFAAEQMEMWPVTKAVGSPKNTGPELVQPLSGKSKEPT